MITGFKGSDKVVGFCGYDYSDCINRWQLKRVAKKLMKSSDMRKIKISFIDSEKVCGERFNYYRAEADGEVKYIQMDFNDYEGAHYYECFKVTGNDETGETNE